MRHPQFQFPPCTLLVCNAKALEACFEALPISTVNCSSGAFLYGTADDPDDDESRPSEKLSGLFAGLDGLLADFGGRTTGNSPFLASLRPSRSACMSMISQSNRPSFSGAHL